MIGTSWLVQVNAWWKDYGHLGAPLGFLFGGLALVPVAVVYARLVQEMPSSAAEVEFAAGVLPPGWGFFAGWSVILAYGVVCPWEAVQLGRIAATLVPGFARVLYVVGGEPVTMGHIVVGISLTALLLAMHLRGIATVALVQQAAVYMVFALTLAALVLACARGSLASLAAPARHGPIASAFGMILTTPFFLSGFETPSKYAEERSLSTTSRDISVATVLALGVGASVYVGLLTAVGAMAWLWDGQGFATARVFARASGVAVVEPIVLLVAMVSLFKCFNGSLLTASRMMWAMAARHMLPARLAETSRGLVPAQALWAVTGATIAATLLGNAILKPLSEVGALSALLAWATSALAASRRFRQRATTRAIAWLAVLVCSALAVSLVLDWLTSGARAAIGAAVVLWWGLGAIVYRRAQRISIA
jgi:amino acid transporter